MSSSGGGRRTVSGNNVCHHYGDKPDAEAGLLVILASSGEGEGVGVGECLRILNSLS